MAGATEMTLDEAHLAFAKQANGEVWSLLDKADRSADEDHAMVVAAFASLYHWRAVGQAVHHQRGEWLIAHVFTVLGDVRPAVAYAERCMATTEAHRGQMTDFDLAYAYEGLARAHALAGRDQDARHYLAEAMRAGSEILDPDDRSIFEGDVQGGDWHGIQ
ncbi:MAG: hypothetical protein MUF84_03295 [Anaerolineae bacterium]|jgi:hypothetical protein|nr:hypothetical protein [Anaerolineae bacterium]